MKEIIDKLDFIKIKNFCSMIDNDKRMIRHVTNWEKAWQKTHLIKIVIQNTKNNPLKTQQYKNKKPNF